MAKIIIWNQYEQWEVPEQLHQALDDFDGIVCVADDILVYGVGDTTKDAMEDHQKKLTPN